MSLILTLVLEFFKIGLFAAGGGLATLPFLTELADKYPWLTSEMIGRMVALSESTPGPLGINMATYAGFMAGANTFGSPFAGVLTALTATVSLVAPSFIVILIVSRVLEKFKSSRYVKAIFGSLRPAVAGLIAAAAWTVISVTLFNFSAATVGEAFLLPEIALFAVMLVITNLKPLKKLHPLVFIGFAAAAGVAMGYAFGW